MLTLKPALPNFAKTVVFVVSAIFSIGAFAAHHEEGEKAAMNSAESMTHEAEQSATETMGAVEGATDVADEAEAMADDAGEEIPDLKDMVSE